MQAPQPQDPPRPRGRPRDPAMESRILEAANHPLVTLADTMDGAADKAAELANA